jgi:hypothetical protein
MTLPARKAPCAPDFLKMEEVGFSQPGNNNFITPFLIFIE